MISPSLLFLTNLGCIDHNPWSSRTDDLEHPDYFFFDLDPSEGATFDTVLEIGRALCGKLDEIGLHFFLKTSGATGLHIYIPVERIYTYQQLRAFGDVIAHLVARELPKHVTFERTVAKRPRGSVLIDVDQNAEGRPLAAAYSVRAFPQAAVSTPLLPRELRAGLRPEKFNLKSIIGPRRRQRRSVERILEAPPAHRARRRKTGPLAEQNTLKPCAFAVIVYCATFHGWRNNRGDDYNVSSRA